jgi:hypothetical protein
MNKQDALKELSQVEKRLKELRKIIEQPESIFDRIKTLEQAKETLSIKDDCFSTNNHSKRAFAFQNLCIIIEALNEGWYPNWDNINEYKYFIWWKMEGGFSYYSAHCHDTSTGVPSALCFKSRELAEYCAKQFEQLYKDLYL